MLRLGRMRYRIAEIKTNSKPSHGEIPKMESSENLRLLNSENNLLQIFRRGENDKNVSSQSVVVDEELKQEDIVGKIEEGGSPKACRICFGETDEINDPFISICKCKGSMKYIHFLCLQKWVQNRVTFKTTTYLHSYVWKNFDCEICKEDLPCTSFPSYSLLNIVSFAIHHGSFISSLLFLILKAVSIVENGKKLNLVEIRKPFSNYIFFQILTKDMDSVRGFHIINLDINKDIKLVFQIPLLLTLGSLGCSMRTGTRKRCGHSNHRHFRLQESCAPQSRKGESDAA